MNKYLKKSTYLVAALAFSLNAFADTQLDLFRAARADNPSGVKSLIERGVNPNLRDEHGQTALLVAMREPSPRVIDVMLASPKVDVDAANSKDETPLMMAALKGQQDLVDKLLARDAAINKPGWTPLHYAATNGHISIMKELLDKYAFINAQSPNGTTPLMMAAGYGSVEAVKLLIDEGADQGMKNQQGMTALDFAKRANRGDAIQLLSRGPGAAAAPKRPTDGKW
ncbi:MAG: ankyrin repeat domain-containing protein [Proteobacteria bacterium]|nr:ankyrin repeat domain-containing protein [Pseudomonadota bacterium]